LEKFGAAVVLETLAIGGGGGEGGGVIWLLVEMVA